MAYGKKPGSTYAVTDPELTIISEKRDLRFSVGGSTEVSYQCLAVVTNQIRSYDKRTMKQSREHSFY